MRIHSGIHDYELTIEESLAFVEPLLHTEQTYYVVDANVHSLYPALFASIPRDRLGILAAVEENKTLDTALAVCEQMTALAARRNARLVSVGGGITQDVTGFAANVLYRGVHWTFVPTTLLAACDSCIGGKTSLNYKGYKNLLGTFYPPERIYVCAQFFDTLTERDFLSGMGEVVKFNLLMGEKGFADVRENLPALLTRDYAAVRRFTENALLFKKGFIEADEYDTGVRVHLNFAHTFGHALESASHYAIPHGTAVAMGMIVANRISVMRGLLDKENAARMEELLLAIIPRESIPADNDVSALTAAIHNDKKQVGDGITAVLLKDGGELSVVHDVTEEEVRAGYARLAAYAAPEADCQGAR